MNNFLDLICAIFGTALVLFAVESLARILAEAYKY